LDIKLCELCRILEKGLIASRFYEDNEFIVFNHKGLPMLMLKEHKNQLDKNKYEIAVDILKDTCGGGSIIGPKNNTNHFHIYLIK